jgi:DNA-binding transcriptional LysR family regulator
MFRQLEYLTALARHHHFGRAAAACHVSQPALSAGIRKLETEFGVPIVHRAQRFEGFTSEGQEILEWARRALAEYEAVQSRIAAARGQVTGTLRIGAIPTALSVTSLLTGRLRERHPAVRFSVESMSSREIVARLNDFEIDVGVTYVDGDPLGKARVRSLYRERYVFVTPIDGPLGNLAEATWADAASADLCLLAPSMQNRRIIDGHFADAGMDVEPVVETSSISALYAHVASMKLSSVVPQAWLQGFGVPAGSRVVPLAEPARSYHVGLVLAGSGPEPYLATALAEVGQSIDFDYESIEK